MRTGRRGLKSHSYKKRKSMFSFGDVILPVVGILAVIMLVFAAKVFFFDSLPSSGNLYVPKVQPEEDIIQAANAQEQKQKQESEAEAGAVAEVGAGRESAENLEPENFIFENSNNTANIEVTAEPINNNNNNNQAASQADSKAAAVNNILRAQNNNKSAENKAVNDNNNAEAQNNNKQVNNAQVKWRVQVGAYGSKKAAEEIIAKLAKAGYRATHFAVSKYHKVWVQAGDTKQEAERAAERLKKLGYKGSYVIAPPPVKSQK